MLIKEKKKKKKKKSCEVGLGRLISNAQLIYISLGVSIDGVNIYIYVDSFFPYPLMY
jgi:hypothetical protein